MMTPADARLNREKLLADGTMLLYDVTSSYFEGHTSSLAKLGHNRNGTGCPTVSRRDVLSKGRMEPSYAEFASGHPFLTRDV